MKKLITAISCCSLALSAQTASAEVLFNGFFSAGLGKTTKDEYSYVGYDDKVSYTPDTLLGLQFTGILNDYFSATGQFVSRGNNDFEVEMDWAYGAFTYDNLIIKAGKLRTPFYMFSDYIDVAYAYLWVRPPQQVYGGIPLNSMNGIDFNYSIPLGSVNLGIQAFAGRDSLVFEDTTTLDLNSDGLDDTETLDNTNIELEDRYGLVLSMSYEWLNVRAGYNQSKFYGQSLLFDNLNAQIPSHDVYIAEDPAKTKYMNAGFNIDWNNILVLGEYTKLDVDRGFFRGFDGWYLTGGYRFNIDTSWLSSITPHITYGVKTNQDNYKRVDSSGNALVDAATQAVFDAATPFNQNMDDEDSGITVGLRFDLPTSAAFKIEYEHVEQKRLKSTSTPTQGEQETNKFGLISMSLDMVF